jgi:formylglycine-generating enzyme required for sulfatase activity
VNRPTRSLSRRFNSLALVAVLLGSCFCSISALSQDKPKAPGAAAPTAPGAPGAPTPKAAPAAEAPAAAAKPDPEAAIAEAFKKEENTTNSLGMVMVWVKAGYRVAQLEVTQDQYQKVAGDNPSRFPGGNNPVERVTWTEANAFCATLTEKELAAGKLPKGYAYSLPSEAQWEYYVADADLKDAVTSRLGDQRSPQPVGSLGANKLGLQDVRGNVFEWCSTPFARGGSFRTFEDWLQTSFRFAGDASMRYDDIGFRIILTGSK